MKKMILVSLLAVSAGQLFAASSTKTKQIPWSKFKGNDGSGWCGSWIDNGNLIAFNNNHEDGTGGGVSEVVASAYNAKNGDYVWGGEPIKGIYQSHNVSSDGKVLALLTMDKLDDSTDFDQDSANASLRFFDTENGKQIGSEVKIKEDIEFVEFQPKNSQSIYLIDFAGEVKLFNRKKSKFKILLKSSKEAEKKLDELMDSGLSRPVPSNISTNGLMAFTDFDDNKNIKVYSIWEGKLLFMLKGHEDEIIDLQLSRDGTRLASVSKDKTVRIWDIGEKQELSKFNFDFDFADFRFPYFIFTNDLSTMISFEDDGIVKFFDTQMGKIEDQINTGLVGDGHKHLELSPDGSKLLTSFEDMVKIWHIGVAPLKLNILQTIKDKKITIPKDYPKILLQK